MAATVPDRGNDPRRKQGSFSNPVSHVKVLPVSSAMYPDSHYAMRVAGKSPEDSFGKTDHIRNRENADWSDRMAEHNNTARKNRRVPTLKFGGK